MKLLCHLRGFRGDRSLRAIADQAGINAGTLSLIELGRLLPKDDQVEALEQAYGRQLEDWYSKRALVAVREDDEA